MVPLLLHKKAHFEYEILDTVVAGLVLTGGEVKMLRGKHGSLTGSYVKIIGGQAFLLNAQIPPYPYARSEDYDPTRTRKLLLNKREILQLEQAQATKGYTLVATKIGAVGNHIKVEVAVARGKSGRDRREELRNRDMKRDADRELKRRW